MGGLLNVVRLLAAGFWQRPIVISSNKVSFYNFQSLNALRLRFFETVAV